MGVGLWNRARGRYLLPGATATATRPGWRGQRPPPGGVLQRRVPHPGATAGRHRRLAVHGRRRVVARSRPGHRARAGEHLAVLRRCQLRQAGPGRMGRLEGAADRTDGSDPGQPLRARPGGAVHSSMRARRRCRSVAVRRRVRGQPPALRDLRAARQAALSRVRADAAAPLGVGELQRVPRQPDRDPIRRSRDPLDRDHARGSGARPPVRGSRRRRRVRGVGGRGAALPPRPRLQRHHGLFDGRDRQPSGWPPNSPTCSPAPKRRSEGRATTTYSRRCATFPY